MQNNNGEGKQPVPKKKTAGEEIWEAISSAYKALENWVRPNKNQPVILQIVLFIAKLPVLFLLLLFSPILLIILLLIFFLAL